MVFILGKHFPDTQLVRKTLTSLYGISGTSAVLSASKSRSPAALKTVMHAHAASPKVDANQTLASQAPLSPRRHSLLARLLAQHHIHPSATLAELSETRLNALTASLAEETIEMDLRRQLQSNIRRMRDMGSYRGRRHALGLPVRGQKTKGQVTTSRKLNRTERRG